MDKQINRVMFLSGLCSSLGLAPHLGFLLLLFVGKWPAPLGFLATTYIAAIFLGEYLFYKMIVQKISFLDWLKHALHPFTPGYFLWAYVSEILFDGIFLSLAIKFGWSPLNFFILLLGCKFLAAPLQTFLSHLFLLKNESFVLAVPAQILLLCSVETIPEFFLYAVILKGVICNGIAVARSQYTVEIAQGAGDQRP